MSLILIKAPKPIDDQGRPAEGMDVTAHEIAPGRAPTFVNFNCLSCDKPVERFTIDYVASPFYLPVQYECHGKTRGMRIPAQRALWMARQLALYGTVPLIDVFEGHNG